MKIVSASLLFSHDNWSAEFWENHDQSKCDICKGASK